MTAAAIVDDADVIKIRRTPGVAGVAVITGIAAFDMCRMLAAGCNPIVAGIAGTDHLQVIDREHGDPDVCVVAVFADVAGLDVIRRLALRFRAVVTAEAVARDIHVIEIGRRPACGRVAVVAGIAAGYMRRILAGRYEAVVARGTGADDLCMVDCRNRLPRIA